MTAACWTDKEGDLKDIKHSGTDDNGGNFHNTWTVIAEIEYFGWSNGRKVKNCATVQLCQYQVQFSIY